MYRVKHLATDLSRYDISRRQPGPSDTSLGPFQAIARGFRARRGCGLLTAGCRSQVETSRWKRAG